MLSPLSRTFDVLQEGLLSDVYWEDCWPQGLPASQTPPTARDLAVLDELIADDVVLAALGAGAGVTLRAAALAIERRVPFLTSSGATLPAPHRLFLSLEIAKVFSHWPRDDLRCLASVVVYPGVTKLRRGSHEVGALLMRGPFRLLPHLAHLEKLVGLFADLSAHGGAPKAWRRALREHLDECGRWRHRIQDGTALADEESDAFVTFVAAAPARIEGHLQELRRAPGTRQFSRDNAAALRDLQDSVASLASQLIEAKEALAVPAQASIHLPWSTQLQCHTTTGHDPLVHELAHLVDFVHGGVDGVPSSSSAEGWQRAWEELEGGGLGFLGAYARTNAAELFAVATEHFFTDAAALQASSPSLATLLQATWGFTPATRPRRSSWWLARRLLWSKLSGTFD